MAKSSPSSSKPKNTAARAATACAVAAVVLLGACGSSSKSSSPTTTTTQPGKSFQVQTADGQVSVSLNGELPPGWPASFPVPSDATAAGSGSLANSSNGAMIAVFKTTGAPADAFNFYKTNSSLTVTSSAAVGTGANYVGNVKLGGATPGNVTVVATGGTTNIIVALTGVSTTTTTSGGSTSSTTAGSTTSTT